MITKNREMHISAGHSERTFQLKYKPGVGYQWRYDDGEPYSPVFRTQLEAEMWERREHGELDLSRVRES